MNTSDLGQSIIPVRYKNHRGVESVRNVIINKLWWGSTEWHPQPQWLLNVTACDKAWELRDFALKDCDFRVN